MDNYILGHIIRIRKERNISQQKMAEILHITQSSYAKIENGKIRLSVLHFTTIMDFLQIDAASVLPQKGIIETLDSNARIADLENKITCLQKELHDLRIVFKK